jgi:hypothetical protein
MPQKSRIYPALFCSAAIYRGAGSQSVTLFLNHPTLQYRDSGIPMSRSSAILL